MLDKSMLVAAPRIGQRNNRLPSAYSNLPAEPRSPINTVILLLHCSLLVHQNKTNTIKNLCAKWSICALLQNIQGVGVGYKLNKMDELVIFEARWWECGRSLYYILFLYFSPLIKENFCKEVRAWHHFRHFQQLCEAGSRQVRSIFHNEYTEAYQEGH